MKTKLKNKRIIVSAQGYEQVLFDIGTTKFFTQFDGRGGFKSFHYANNPRYNINAQSYLNIFIDGEPLSIFTKKKVINCGRIQKIIYELEDGKIVISQFGYESFILNRIKTTFKTKKEIVLVNDYTAFVDVPKLVSNYPYEYLAPNYSYVIKANGSKDDIKIAISFTDDPKKIVRRVNSIEKQLTNEIDDMVMPEIANTEERKALYCSSMFTALENYKEIPNFSALTAGVNYVSPFRTYYRDSYWTILCLHKEHKDIVKNQIITLAKGIKDDGECPSAVKADYTSFWGGHYDSPFFFVMEVFDYINHSGDNSILNEVINGKFTILELCQKVVNRMMTFADDTHLIYKRGPLNRLDWADAVNRDGYVTYDECLYCRALMCLGSILGGDNIYLKEAEVVKDAINNILWSEDLGYYVNYIDGDYTEANLSIDTILAVLFEIVPTDKKERFIDNLENKLYAKNHAELEDFGVLTVYPNYKRYTDILSKSSLPYWYHNGANWPYWTGMFAYMLMLNGRDYEYALSHTFNFAIKNHKLTPLEYISPYFGDGSNLQAWSATPAFAMQYSKDNFFKIK